MQFFHIMDGPPLFTNCFLLVGDQKHAVAVDPAAPVSAFAQKLEESGATLTHILLTHGHPDHIGSVKKLCEKYGAKLLMNEADAKQFHMQADAYFTDGGTIEVDDMTFTTIFTPGHTPGSTVIRCGNYLMTGDTLFAGDIGRTDFPGGDMQQMRQSLQKILREVPDNPQILPGHEEFSTMDVERRVNPYLKF